MIGRSRLINSVGLIAESNLEAFGACGQAVVGALLLALGTKFVPEPVFKCATGLSGGCVESGNVCGAVSGGILVLSLFSGRDLAHWSEMSKKLETYELGQELTLFIESEYGSINCTDIKECLAKNKGFSTSKSAISGKETEKIEPNIDCRGVVSLAAIKVTKILLDRNLVTDGCVKFIPEDEIALFRESVSNEFS